MGRRDPRQTGGAGRMTPGVAPDVCARRAGQRIVTSDPDDLRALDPAADLVSI